MRYDADVTIIGAGVVGLAIAESLASADRDICVLERHDGFGRETSSRNSEVVHAGLYYAPGSLKALLCVEGRRALYRICERRGIAFARPGKIVVAHSDAEAQRLEALWRNGLACDAGDLRMLSRGEMADLEPDVRAHAAFLSPETGIVDSHGLMESFERGAREKGALVAYGSCVVGIDPERGGGYRVHVEEAGSFGAISTRAIVNCAGLGAEAIARMVGIDVEAAGYRLYPCKGEYFSVRASAARRVRRLVYPLPTPEGVGVHVTFDLEGRMRLGPNAHYVELLDYAVDASQQRDLFESARRFLPFLEFDDLAPDMAGIRPKIQAPGAPPRDFVIRHEADRGLSGLVNLIGIESPGLTASPAIARHVAKMVEEIWR